MKKIDMTGQRIGRLIARKLLPPRNGQTMWECLCDCGNTKAVSGGALHREATRSCGCLQLETVRFTHGHTRVVGKSKATGEYSSWLSMKQRCLNKNNPAYHNYGGRGIKICDEWIDNFHRFLSDMGPRPKGFSIERNDVNGDYDPSNCSWIPLKDQHNNQRHTIWINLENGTQVTLKTLAEMRGLDYKMLARARLLGKNPVTHIPRKSPKQSVFR